MLTVEIQTNPFLVPDEAIDTSDPLAILLAAEEEEHQGDLGYFEESF